VLYVEPIYTQRKDQDSAYPRLLRVMVSYDRAVGYAPTLYEALRQVGIETDPNLVRIDESGEAEAEAEESSGRPGAETSSPRPSTPSGTGGASDAQRGAAIDEINSALNAVRSAQSSGDLGDLGQALDDLQAAVDAYQALGNGN